MLLRLYLLTGALLPTLSGPALTDEAPPPDLEIERAIAHELIRDPVVRADQLDVSCDGGVVSLTGTVDDLLAEQRSVRVAQAVKGVRSVVERLDVLPVVGLDDQELQRRVEDALLRDPATESYQVHTTVEDGVVRLSGTVDSWTERRLAETVAMHVAGAREVENAIAVAVATERDDLGIQREIEQSLHWDVLIDDALIDVAVSDREVSLSGVVGSAAEKREASLSCWVRGVTGVDDEDLRVERWARDSDLRGNKYRPRGEDELAEAVEAALRRDPRVAAIDVGVSVFGDKVTLEGVVGSLAARRAAAADARNTVGVRRLANLIKVRPDPVFGDERIAQDVRMALTADPLTDRHEIRVSVVAGRVTLSGTVDSVFEKAQAASVAERVLGVTHVSDHLLVATPRPYAYDPWIDDQQLDGFAWYATPPTLHVLDDGRIRREIESELAWSPFVDGDEVRVSVEDGVATLSGTVGSWLEAGAARDNAYDGGALQVVNRLTIEADSGTNQADS